MNHVSALQFLLSGKIDEKLPSISSDSERFCYIRELNWILTGVIFLNRDKQ